MSSAAHGVHQQRPEASTPKPKFQASDYRSEVRIPFARRLLPVCRRVKFAWLLLNITAKISTINHLSLQNRFAPEIGCQVAKHEDRRSGWAATFRAHLRCTAGFAQFLYSVFCSGSGLTSDFGLPAKNVLEASDSSDSTRVVQVRPSLPALLAVLPAWFHKLKPRCRFTPGPGI